MDYKTKISERFGPLSRPGTGDVGEKIVAWLDKNHANWRQEEPSLVSEWILRESIGWHQYDELDVTTTEEAEEFIMETYLGA